jgi:hypothetical protein
MKTREVWMLCTTSLPTLCSDTVARWRALGYKSLVLQIGGQGDCGCDVTSTCERDPGTPAAWNYLTDQLLPRSADLVVLASDTTLPDPTCSATDMADAFFERFPDGVGIMQASDDRVEHDQPRRCVSPYMGRGWIERAYGGYGAIYPKYANFYADFELYWVARSLGALWERPELRQRLNTFAAAPVTHAFDRWLDGDFALLQQRVRMGFPGCQPAGFRGELNKDVLRAAVAAFDELVASRPLSRRRVA